MSLRFLDRFKAKVAAMPDEPEGLGMPEALDTPKSDLEKAGEVFGVVEGLGGDVDAHMADLVTSAGVFAAAKPGDEEAYHETVIVDEAGAFQILKGGDSDDTAEALGEQPVEPLGEALAEIAQSDPSGEAVKVVAEAIDKAKGVEPCESRLGLGVQAIIEDLRLQRERVGYSYSQRDAYEVNQVHYENGGLARVEQALRDPGLDVTSKAALIDELYNVRQHQVEMFIDRYDPEPELMVESAESRMYWLFNDLPASQLKEMMGLPAVDKKRVGYILNKLIAECERRNPLRAKLLRARSEGYDTVTDKFAAIEAGNIKDDSITRLDTLVERDPSKEALRIEDTVVDFLAKDHGLPLVQATEMVVAMRGRCSHPVSDGVSAERRLVPNLLQAEALRIKAAIEEVGIQKVMELRETCGIVNIAELSLQQLDRMARFVDSDGALLEELRQKEVCVILRDATHDWNGGYRGMNKTYETTDGATLIFEVSTLMDEGNQVASFVDILDKAKIRPSVLVVAGHGRAGAVFMGTSRKALIPVVPRLSPPQAEKRYVTFAETRLDTLIGNMKPDRDGNCSIIYKSCSQAAALAHEDDSTLTRTAEVAKKAGEGKVYQVFGTRGSSNVRRDEYGDLV